MFLNFTVCMYESIALEWKQLFAVSKSSIAGRISWGILRNGTLKCRIYFFCNSFGTKIYQSMKTLLFSGVSLNNFTTHNSFKYLIEIIHLVLLGMYGTPSYKEASVSLWQAHT